MPVVAAFILASVVAIFYPYGVKEAPFQLLIPPLVIFLPGSVLTVAVVELAFANIVSGASRLVAGFAQLILLAFGLLGGFRLFGDGIPEHVHHAERLAPGLAWAGVVVFAIGLHLFKSSRRRSLPWVILTMLMAYLGQYVSGHFVDGASTAFFGAAVMTMTALVIEYRYKGPPALVTILPAFWLLAPGSFGLVSVATMATEGMGTAGNILRLLFILTAIATGSLIGAFLYSGLLHVSQVRVWRKGPPIPEDRSPGEEHTSIM